MHRQYRLYKQETLLNHFTVPYEDSFDHLLFIKHLLNKKLSEKASEISKRNIRQQN